jgi:uncharacterized membrane protein
MPERSQTLRPRISPGPATPTATLADHELESLEAVARFHSEHAAQATWPQKVVESLTSVLARPTSVFATVVIALALSLFVARAAEDGVHGALFAWMEFFATVSAVLIAMFILVTQTRADALAERRARLSLELVLLADRRAAKLLSLLEEMRRDDPNLRNRADPESEAMSTPTDPHAVSRAIES